METLETGIWVWIWFNVAIVLLLIFDLFVLTRGDHEVSIKEASLLTVFWTVIGSATGVWLWLQSGVEQGVQYFSAYVAERALSIDNLFVFIVIFGYFQLPKKYQARALLFGIVGAIIARGIFIAVGVTIITYLSWVLFILGAFLIYTAYKLAFSNAHDVDPNKNIAVRLFRKIMPVTDKYDGHNFFTRLPSGALAATPFLLVVISLGSMDIVFAIDSIPTVLGISKDPFIVWSSNAMAVLGMRPLFFLLEGLVRLFRYLSYGLALILAIIGAKIIFEETLNQIETEFHFISTLGDIYLVLGIIVGILIGSVILSVVLPDKSSETHSDHKHTHTPQ